MNYIQSLIPGVPVGPVLNAIIPKNQGRTLYGGKTYECDPYAVKKDYIAYLYNLGGVTSRPVKEYAPMITTTYFL